jgi:hypothetical protein
LRSGARRIKLLAMKFGRVIERTAGSLGCPADSLAVRSALLAADPRAYKAARAAAFSCPGVGPVTWAAFLAALGLEEFQAVRPASTPATAGLARENKIRRRTRRERPPSAGGARARTMKKSVRVQVTGARAQAGLYDMPCDGDELLILPSRRIFIVSDRWCGSGWEGECYRRHVAEVDWQTARHFYRAKDQHYFVFNNKFNWMRLSDAPIWIRRAYQAAILLEGSQADEELGISE